ncbi:MAG: MFS transporter [Candidatus Helarchaeota archaeon]
MFKLRLENLTSFGLISVGIMLTMTFGFVPFFNIMFHYGLDVMWSILFWLPFGLSSLLFGSLIDRVKNLKYLSLIFVFWGVTALNLIIFYGNILVSLILILILAILTGFTTIIGTSYIGSNIKIQNRGLKSGIYLGIGWGLVSITAFISSVDTFLNIFVIALANIIIGLIGFYLIKVEKLNIKWEPLVTIPRDYNVKKNGFVFWESSLIFGIFLGVIVFLLGGNTRYYEAEMWMNFYLNRITYYLQFANSFGMGLINLDFLAIGGMDVILSPIFGKLMDKYGRKNIFLLSNLLIPAVLVLLCFWSIFAFMLISVVFYSIITSCYVIIICTFWSDVAPKKKMSRFVGYGWSSVALGGSLGFIVANFMTLPALNEYIDTMILMVILLISEFSLVPFAFMKESLPPSEEMNWPHEIIHLYIMNEGGIVLVDYSFQQTEELDADLFSGGISGVCTLLQEMTKSNQRLKIIDHEDKKIMFEYGEQFTVALLASKNLGILRTKLISLTNEIQSVFWETIANWDGNIEVFAPINTMIRNYFTE